jgi:hypothetical protein
MEYLKTNILTWFFLEYVNMNAQYSSNDQIALINLCIYNTIRNEQQIILRKIKKPGLPPVFILNY